MKAGFVLDIEVGRQVMGLDIRDEVGVGGKAGFALYQSGRFLRWWDRNFDGPRIIPYYSSKPEDWAAVLDHVREKHGHEIQVGEPILGRKWRAWLDYPPEPDFVVNGDTKGEVICLAALKAVALKP